ncbi:class I adenylate-forming enzyme family protein [Auritidibacter ignavus]|uniref:class I adenylate-forming enzyme family protein n=1 Tax=Auritidibacter ignavus TaxID=678932 RepID=UPI000F035497|nr:AMP-binding protein [Auritidibacter ignavus]NIH72468.1 acyl-CoA synthetase (AMP-forming)/AMP-acid ligase II [Auritidibacter ignavus]RMX23451.1 hypothetical protein DYI20_05120 [Auritidibacter ignavus]
MFGSAITRVDDLIAVNARNLPQEPALTCSELTLNYQDLESYIEGVSNALLVAGVEHGDRVAVLAKNSLPFFGLYFATARIGAILVPLNYWNRAGQHADALSDVTPVLFFHDPEYADVAQEAKVEVASSARLIELEPWGVGPCADSDWQKFLATVEEEDSLPVKPEVNASDPHMILYTSGTTGRPKGAVLSHERTVHDAFAMAATLGIRQTDVFGNWFTPFHVGNWDHQKFFLIMGAHVVLYPQFDAVAVLSGIEEHRITVMLTVPIMSQQLMQHPRFSQTDLSSLRLIYFGAYDPSGIMDRVADTFGVRTGRVDMVHTYGLTEAGCIVTACPANRLLEKWGSIGRPIPGVEVRLLNDTGADAKVDEPGEIILRGPRMSGYWNREEATAEAIVDGWLHTGDVAVRDKDGFLRIVDRKKDMIRTGGQNAYSKEIEDCLSQHPDVQEVAVIGVPDPVYEESICAIVVASDHDVADTLPAVLPDFVRERLAGYNTPRRVVVVNELPKNSLGKIRKPELRKTYGSIFIA